MPLSKVKEERKKAIRSVWYSNNPPSWTFVVLVACLIRLCFFEDLAERSIIQNSTLIFWCLPITLIVLVLALGTWKNVGAFLRYAFFAAVFLVMTLFYSTSTLVVLANAYGPSNELKEGFVTVLEWHDRYNDGDPFVEATIILEGEQDELAFYQYLSEDIKDQHCLFVEYQVGALGYAIIEHADFAESHLCTLPK